MRELSRAVKGIRPITGAKRLVVDVLIDYYTLTGRKKPVLTAKQEAIRKRLVSMYANLSAGKNLATAMRMHQDIYGVNESQAMIDYQRAVKLFGEVTEVETKGMRHIYTQMAQRLFERAEEMGDLRAMTDALKIIDKMNNLGAEKDPGIDPSRLEPTTIIMGIAEEQQERMMQMLAGGVLNFSAVPMDPNRKTIDIDHIEILEDDGTEEE